MIVWSESTSKQLNTFLESYLFGKVTPNTLVKYFIAYLNSNFDNLPSEFVSNLSNNLYRNCSAVIYWGMGYWLLCSIFLLIYFLLFYLVIMLIYIIISYVIMQWVSVIVFYLVSL